MNNDRFRFRAWVIPDKEMTYPDRIEDKDGLSGIVFLSEYIQAIWENDPDENIILMACTGLKDSTKWEELTEEEQKEWLQSGHATEEWQGKLIWEGDIVEAPALELHAICEVYWHDDGFSAGWRIRTNTGLSTGLTTFGGAYSPKIIGNIYENPELLEKK